MKQTLSVPLALGHSVLSQQEKAEQDRDALTQNAGAKAGRSLWIQGPLGLHSACEWGHRRWISGLSDSWKFLLDTSSHPPFNFQNHFLAFKLSQDISPALVRWFFTYIYNLFQDSPDIHVLFKQEACLFQDCNLEPAQELLRERLLPVHVWSR